jgi:hypothetical protein
MRWMKRKRTPPNLSANQRKSGSFTAAFSFPPQKLLSLFTFPAFFDTMDTERISGNLGCLG